jgi:hypothetical protein
MANVIGVAATDENDILASSSNTGSALVAAPGVNIYTTLAGGSYSSVSSTSAASAHVAGLAANGKSNNTIYNQILGATDPIGQSFRRINVTKALGGAVAPVPTPVPTPTPTIGPEPTYVIATPKVGSVTVGAQTGTLTYGTAGSATYTITFARGSGDGSTGVFYAALSVTTALQTGPGSFVYTPAAGIIL